MQKILYYADNGITESRMPETGLLVGDIVEFEYQDDIKWWHVFCVEDDVLHVRECKSLTTGGSYE